jgi:DNA-binding LytR/AlgR family response regulator
VSCFHVILIDFIYEHRKDIWGFIFSRTQVEATPIAVVEDMEWLASSGNYVNLHSKGPIHPTRPTLTQLIYQFEAQGFCRIHRSHAVNLNNIDSITPLSSGDSEVTLNNGKILNLSRRYK